MSTDNTADPVVIRRLLSDAQTWPSLAKENPGRAAYGVARFPQSRESASSLLDLTGATVHGEQGYRTLAEILFDVDVADVFRRSSEAGAAADEAVAIGEGGLVSAGRDR